MTFQSALPRGERHCDRQRAGWKYIISIRAPTRGATVNIFYFFLDVTFQSALPRGERLFWINDLFHICNFNPRSHEGSDTIFIIWILFSLYFNPRSHEGSDSTGHITITGGNKFQSALPRGERLRMLSALHVLGYFNPRSHEGSDLLCAFPLPVSYIFQSALPRGERLIDRYRRADNRDFNPRSHEGSDPVPLSVPGSDVYFNPRSHEGSDSVPIRYSSGSINFNPRSHEGSDHHAGYCFRCVAISIRAPTRGATL